MLEVLLDIPYYLLSSSLFYESENRDTSAGGKNLSLFYTMDPPNLKISLRYFSVILPPWEPHLAMLSSLLQSFLPLTPSSVCLIWGRECQEARGWSSGRRNVGGYPELPFCCIFFILIIFLGIDKIHSWKKTTPFDAWSYQTAQTNTVVWEWFFRTWCFLPEGGGGKRHWSNLPGVSPALLSTFKWAQRSLAARLVWAMSYVWAAV